MEYHTAYLSAGSNIGDKLKNCQNGLNALAESGTSLVTNISRFYKTEPVDYKNQDWFINCAAKIKTKLDPFNFLNELKSIEINAGRTTDSLRFGPRILDLDIIFFDDFVINSPKLVIPHPRMHTRRFVLKPLSDIIDYKIVHPVIKKNILILLENLDKNKQKVMQI